MTQLELALPLIAAPVAGALQSGAHAAAARRRLGVEIGSRRIAPQRIRSMITLA